VSHRNNRPYIRNSEEVFSLFKRRVKRLLETKFVLEAEAGKFDQIELYENSAGIQTFLFPAADADGLDAFLLHYRVLVQMNDTVSLSRIRKRLRYIKCEPHLRKLFIKAVRGLDNYLELNCVPFQWSNKEVLNACLYGEFAHTSPNAYRRLKLLRARLDSFPHSGPREVRRAGGHPLDVVFCGILKQVIAQFRAILAVADLFPGQPAP
jgi:hypothetical protein